MAIISKEHTVVVNTIEWSMSHTGVLSPIATFDTVCDDDGNSLSRVPLGDYQYARSQHINVGSKIKVNRNKCTSIVSASTDKLTLDVCPFCGEPTVRNGRYIMCDNPYCKEWVVHRVHKFCKYYGIPYLCKLENDEYGVVRKVVDKMYKPSVSALFDFELDDWMSMFPFGEGIIPNEIHFALHHIHSDLESLLNSFDIYKLSKRNIHSLCYGFDGDWDTMHHYMKYHLDLSWALNSVCEKSIHDYFDKFLLDAWRIKKKIKVWLPLAWTKTDIRELYIYSIGDLQMFKNRQDICNYITKKKGIYTNTSRLCDVLVCDFIDDNRQRVDACIRRGVTLITSRELIERCRNV